MVVCSLIPRRLGMRLGKYVQQKILDNNCGHYVIQSDHCDWPHISISNRFIIIPAVLHYVNQWLHFHFGDSKLKTVILQITGLLLGIM